MKLSVNCCSNCGNQLTLTEDKLGLEKCTTCIYFSNIGVETIQEYNKWLQK